jgi:hypothetical protein
MVDTLFTGTITHGSMSILTTESVGFSLCKTRSVDLAHDLEAVRLRRAR